jgi:uncharacterized membrane protein
MNRYLRDLVLILALTGLWAFSGYLIGSVLDVFGITGYPFGIIGASINVIIGLLWLKGIIRDPVGDRLFFEGPSGDESGDLRIGCLWAMPVVLAFIGLFLWLWAVIFRFLVDK